MKSWPQWVPERWEPWQSLLASEPQQCDAHTDMLSHCVTREQWSCNYADLKSTGWPSSQLLLVRRYHCGLPFKSLQMECGEGPGVSGTLNRASWAPLPYGGIGPLRWQQTAAMLPVFPLFPGFLLDTLLYAAIAFLVWHLTGRLRSHFCAAVNRSPSCGDAPAGLPAPAACPERGSDR
jgi:hypothetical protein